MGRSVGSSGAFTRGESVMMRCAVGDGDAVLKLLWGYERGGICVQGMEFDLLRRGLLGGRREE